VKPISPEELAANKETYLFSLLPGFDYAEVDAFVLHGRKYKVLLSAPTGTPKGKPAYAVLMCFVLEKPEPHEGWAICPWLSTLILERLENLPSPEWNAAQLAELRKVSLPASEVPGQGQPGS
jgi:hypothetical protein